MPGREASRRVESPSQHSPLAHPLVELAAPLLPLLFVQRAVDRRVPLVAEKLSLRVPDKALRSLEIEAQCRTRAYRLVVGLSPMPADPPKGHPPTLPRGTASCA